MFGKNVNTGGKVAYSVVAGVIWFVWIGAAVVSEVKRFREGRIPVMYVRRDSPNENPMVESSEEEDERKDTKEGMYV